MGKTAATTFIPNSESSCLLSCLCKNTFYQEVFVVKGRILPVFSLVYPLLPKSFVVGWGSIMILVYIQETQRKVGLKSAENPLSAVQRDCAVSCLNEFSCPILAGLWLGEGLVEYISGTLMQLGWFIYYKNLLFFLTTFALVTWLWCEHLIPPCPPPLYPITFSGAQIPGISQQVFF